MSNYLRLDGIDVKFYIRYLKTYLNWQKMSAYSVEIPTTCKTVTLKVNSLVKARWSGISSSLISDDIELSPRPESASHSINSSSFMGSMCPSTICSSILCAFLLSIRSRKNSDFHVYKSGSEAGPSQLPTFRRFESDPRALPHPHLVRIVLVHDGLDGHPEVTADVTFLAHDRHFVDQSHRIEEIAKIDETASYHTEPRESVVEWIASR